MRLKRFHVQGFAQLEDVDITFRDDAPNLIIGLNEAGKSHLMLALQGMFFGIKNPERFQPWRRYSPSMTVTLEFIDSQGQLVRLLRDLGTKDVQVTVGGELPWLGRVDGKTPDALKFNQCVQSWLGFGEGDIFCCTTFIQQADVVRADLKGLTPAIKQLITGTIDADYDDVRKDIVGQLDELRMVKAMHKPRLLEVKRAELEELERGFRSSSNRQNAFALLQNERVEVEAQLETLTSQLHAEQKILQRTEKLVSAERQEASLRMRWRALDAEREQRDALRRRMDDAGAVRERLAPFTDVGEVTIVKVSAAASDATKRVRELASKATEVDDEALTELDHAVELTEQRLARFPVGAAGVDPVTLTRLEARVRELTARLEGERVAPVPTPASPITWIAAGIGAAIAVVLGIAVHPAAFALLIFVLAFVVIRIRLQSVSDSRGSLTSKFSSDDLAAVRGVLDAALRKAGVASVNEAIALHEQHVAAEAAVRDARDARLAALSRFGVTTTDAVRAQRDRFTVAVAAQNSKEGELADMLGRLGTENVDEATAKRHEYDRAVSEIAETRTALEALAERGDVTAELRELALDISVTHGDTERLLDEDVALKALETPQARATYCDQHRVLAEDIESRISLLETRRRDVEQSLYVQQGDFVDVATLILQMENVRADIARMEQRVAALEVARDTLKASVAYFHDHCLGPVAADTTELLNSITFGRYTNVDLGSDDLVPTVDTAERRGIPSESLSRGVRDQLYFSLRVSLARQLAGGLTLPLIIDDPFVNFDMDRLEHVLEVLNAIAQRTQVILFTCDRQYERWLRPVLVLPDPSARSKAQPAIERVPA